MVKLSEGVLTMVNQRTLKQKYLNEVLEYRVEILKFWPGF